MLHYTLLVAGSQMGNHSNVSLSLERNKVTEIRCLSGSVASVTVPHRHSALRNKTSPDSIKHSERNKTRSCHSYKHHGPSRPSSGRTNIISGYFGSYPADLSLKSAQLLRRLYTEAECFNNDCIKDCTFCCACLWPRYCHKDSLLAATHGRDLETQ